jgi:hypothetical protein
MQVHKEAIDKVPNSLPNRSNIEIEIYGMEGIPAQDLKDHEKNKNGNKSESDDDEPSAKKNKLEPAAAAAMPPQMMMQNMVPNMAQFPMMMQRKKLFRLPRCSSHAFAHCHCSWISDDAWYADDSSHDEASVSVRCSDLSITTETNFPRLQ